jgi:hypothetical protein
MAQMPNIAGVAWSVDEGSYHPTIFVQGSPVPQAPLPLAIAEANEKDTPAGTTF